MIPAMMSEAGQAAAISKRLEKTTTELRELEQLLMGQAVDARVLTQFRDAINHARRTGWAVQQWLELRDKKGDTFTVGSILATERVRVATQLAKDISLDLDGYEITVETEGLIELITAIRALYERLERLRKRQ